MQNTANNLNGHVGKMVILPSTFIESLRNMLQNYQNAMLLNLVNQIFFSQ